MLVRWDSRCSLVRIHLPSKEAWFDPQAWKMPWRRNGNLPVKRLRTLSAFEELKQVTPINAHRGGRKLSTCADGMKSRENLTGRLHARLNAQPPVGFSPQRVLRYFSDAQSAGIQMFVHYPKSLPAADTHRLAICRSSS